MKTSKQIETMNTIYVIRPTLRSAIKSPLLATVFAILATTPLGVSQSTWTGAASPDLNWSTFDNWTFAPAGQNVLFNSNGAIISNTSVTNPAVTSIVDDNFSVESLDMSYMATVNANTYTYQNIQINAGKTLTLNGSLSVGATTEILPDTNYLYSNTLKVGGSGSLVINGGGTGNVTVNPQVTGSLQSRYRRQAVLNLQDLSSFSATGLDRFILGGDQSGGTAWVGSWVVLGTTNTIQASSMVLDGFSSLSRIQLGQTNSLHIDDILIGHQAYETGQMWNGGAAELTFRSGLSGATVTIRGSDGSGAANLLVGRSGTAIGTTSSGQATLNLTGGTTDAKVNNFVIGLADQGGRTAAGDTVSANATLGAGLVEASNVIVGRTTTGNTSTAGATATATLTINNASGTLDVAGNVLIGDAQQSSLALNSTVNLQAGILKASTISTGANAAGNKLVSFNWSSSTTIQNHADSDLLIGAGVDLTLLGTGEHRFNIDTGRNGTVASNILSSASGSVVKNGNGVLTITSTGNTYAGQTIINSGTLIVNGDISSSSLVIVGNGNTLAGTGIVSAITVNGGGRIGHNGLTATSLTWGGVSSPGTAQYQIDLSSSDRLELSGAFSKSSGTYFIFDFLNTGSVGTHTLLSGWSSTTFSASDFSYINLSTGLSGAFSIDGNSLNFTVVPEPSTAMLGLFAAIALVVAVQRKRRATR